MTAAPAGDLIRALRRAVPDPIFTVEALPDAYRFEALLPELTPASLHVRLDTGALRLTANCEAKAWDERFLSYVRERRIDERFALPDDANSTGWLVERHGERVAVTIPRLGNDA